MFCKNCGSKLDDNALFCANCGAKVDGESSLGVTEKASSDTMSSTVIQNNNAGVSSNNDSNFTNNKSSNLRNLLIILIICLFVGGIVVLGYTLLFKKSVFGKNKNVSNIEYALNNMVNMEGYKLNFVLDMDADSLGEEISASLNALATVDVKNNMVSLNLDINEMGTMLNIPAYLDLNNSGNIYFKIPMFGDDWYKISTSSFTSADLSLGQFSDVNFVVEDYLSNDEFIEKVDSSNNVDKYILHYTKEVIEKLANDENNGVDINSLDELGLTDGFDVELYINNKDNYVTKLAFDLSGKTIDGIEFKKFVFSLEITDVNNIESIVIPSEALSAVAFDLNDILGDIPDIDINDDYNDLSDDDLSDDDLSDNVLTGSGYNIKINMPSGYEASSVNSSSFKIFRKDGMRVILSVDYDTKDSFFEALKSEKEDALNDGNKDVTLSDIKELSYNGKTFYYQTLEYIDKYGDKEHTSWLCYPLDNKYVYSVTYEDEDNVGSVTEKSMKDFLDISINK